MRENNVFTFQKVCILAGVCLIAGAIITLFLWQWNINVSIRKSQDYVNTLRTSIPAPQSAVPEERQNNIMPVLSVAGTDFVGVIEMPRYSSVLPVCANWGHASKYPSLFSGSIYNRTLQIGATSQKGQYDFYREISVGDTVLFTDTSGNCYTLKVTSLHYEKHADQTTLTQDDGAMTLFIKNTYAFEYLIVNCDIA